MDKKSVGFKDFDQEQVPEIEVKGRGESVTIILKAGQKTITISKNEWMKPSVIERIAGELGVDKRRLFVEISDKIARANEGLEKEETGEEKRRVERIVFKDLGSNLLQEVYDDQAFRFILFDQETGDWRFIDEYEDPNLQVVYRPTNIPVSKIGLPRVILPAKPEEYGDGKKLLDDVAGFIKKYDELSDDDLWLATRFVLHTWIYDIGDYAMQLLVLGMFGSGKTRLFKTLRLVCYNALGLAGGSSLSAYRRLQERFRGTLLVNEFEPNNSEDSNEIILWINNGFERDLPVALSNKKDPSKQEFFDPFCPKLLTSRSMIENVATRSRLVVIRMVQKTRRDIPIHLPEEAYKEAAELRNRLLSFRLKHWKQNYELPSEIDTRLREASDIDDRFKQTMMPMLLLYSVTGLDVEEVFNFYRKQQALFKRDIALGTTEGIVFNILVETAKQESFEDPEFYGWIDENRRLVGVGSSLLKERTGFSTRTITKALEKIGLKLERASFKVLVWNKRLNEPEARVKTLRLWRFPDEKTWRRAFRLYAYQEPDSTGVSVTEPECPPVLRSSAFIPCDACDACDVSRNSVAESAEEREGESLPTGEGESKPTLFLQASHPSQASHNATGSNLQPETGSSNGGSMVAVQLQKPAEAEGEKHGYLVFREEKRPVYGAEGQPCVFCGKPGGSIRLRNGEIFYAHDDCLTQNPDIRLPSCGREGVLEYLIAHGPGVYTSREIKNALAPLGISESAVQDALEQLKIKKIIRFLALGKYEFSGLKEENANKETLPEKPGPEIETLPSPVIGKLKQLAGYRPSLPLIQRGRCFVCDKEYEGKFFNLSNSNGWDLVSLCPDCFQIWRRHFGKQEAF